MVKNQTSGGDIFITDITTTDATYAEEITGNFEDYVNSTTGNISIMVFVDVAGSPGSYVTIYTDFIKIDVACGGGVDISFNSTISMRDEDVDYLVYKLHDFDSNIFKHFQNLINSKTSFFGISQTVPERLPELDIKFKADFFWIHY